MSHPRLRALALLALAAPCVLTACRKQPPPPAAPAAPAPTAEQRARQAVTEDPGDLFNAGAKPAVRTFSQPVLAFEARDRGLPTSGTWIGYPLLQDFNGDGRADLVASNREEDGYSAWESAQDGSWVRRIAGPVTDAGPGQGLPRDMAYGPARAADCNGDGIPDLLVSAHTDALRVFLNDGHMAWTRSSAPIENPFLMIDIAVGNLNGDAFPDVAGIAHFDGGVGLYLGDGKGGFRRLPESAAVLPKRSMGKAIQLADLDGDGTDDLVMATNLGLKAVLVRRGETLSFEDVSAGLPVPSIGNSIYSAVAGRFAPGGWLQIAAAIVANPLEQPDQRDYVGVWAWDPQAKRWHHVDKGLPRQEAYRDLVAADFDKDGHLDLLTISIESAAVVWLGAGDGSFRAAGRLEGSYNKGRAAVGDVDGDGWTDVVVAIPAAKENPEAGRVRCYRNRAEIWQQRK